MEIKSRLLITRFKVIIFLVLCSFFAITLYLFHLQVNLSLLFFRLSQRNFLRYEKINSPRGNIVDCQGKIVATNRPVYAIFWQGTGERFLTPEQTQLLNRLHTILNLTPEHLEKIPLIEKRRQEIQLTFDANLEQLSQLLEFSPHHKNIVIRKHFKRYYPYNTVASHLIGYLGLDLEETGKMGLELVCNKSLKGQSGEIVKIINSIGHNLASYQSKQASAGGTLQTTLNLTLQMIAEELFPDDKAGSCILLNPRTGAIEVLLSRPSFDPNIFLNSIDLNHWNQLQAKKSFINRALNATYPPASLFKLVTLAAAIETQLITTSTQWTCYGYSIFADRAYHCSRENGHGHISTEQALAHSCNIPFFEIGKRIKIDTLADYAHRLGLGTKTNIMFHEKIGLIPTTKWKKSIKGESWWPGETLSAAIGQSFILVTPMQIACMVSALCEGYFVKPRILEGELIEKRPIELRNETLVFIRKCMKAVIRLGTGSLLNRLKDFTLYGKTGTAQTSSLIYQDLGQHHLPHKWFVLHFQYKDYEPHTLVLMIENAGSTSVAIQFAHRFLYRYAQQIDLLNRASLSPSSPTI